MAYPYPRGRRQHTKSRKGCERCKSRKVKCDETHPTCQNCCRLGLPCKYGPPPSYCVNYPQTGFVASQPAFRPTRSRDDVQTRMLDLRMLHHFLTTARTGFPFQDDVLISRFWTISVPSMAFEHEFLLDALLGATAFHTAAWQPDDTGLTQAGYVYYSRAVSGHREALSVVDRSTADPLCIASIFIMLTTFRIHCEALAHTPYSPPSQWFRIINGMGSLMRLSKSLLGQEGVRLLTERSHTPRKSDCGIDGPPYLPNINEFLSSASTEFDNSLSEDAIQSRRNFGQIVHDIYLDALAGVSTHETRYELLGLACDNNEEFLRLIEQEDVLTIIILSHFFALLEWAGGNWWLQSGLDSEVSRLCTLIPSELQWAVAQQSNGSEVIEQCEVLTVKT